jgi:DNA-binding MarR family transcriptional regulator
MIRMTNFSLDPNSHEGDTAAKIVFALERLSHLFRIHWWEENKNFQLSPLQMQLLITLRFQPQLNSVSALADYLELTRATVSDAAQTLNQKGYLLKRADAADGRRHKLVLTAAGLETAEALAQFADRVRDLVQTLPQPGFFLENLLQLMQQLQASGFIPLQPMCTSCRHFRRTPDAASPYYCQLLDQPLLAHELRIHCPEHAAP